MATCKKTFKTLKGLWTPYRSKPLPPALIFGDPRWKYSGSMEWYSYPWINKSQSIWRKGSYIIDKVLECSTHKYRVSLPGWRIWVKYSNKVPADLIFCKLCHCRVEFQEQWELGLFLSPCLAHLKSLSDSWDFQSVTYHSHPQCSVPSLTHFMSRAIFN